VKDARLWLVGCGNMAGAMLGRWMASGVVRPGQVTVILRGPRPLPDGVRAVYAVPDDPPPDILMLGVKPQVLDEVAPLYAGVRPHMLVSILAGVEEATLAAHFSARAIVRAMPNLPVAIGKGVVALHSKTAGVAERDAVAALMAPLGLVEWIDDAALFDAVTALAGSGPGFVYRFIDALARAGASLGIPAEQAARLALATVEGAGALAAGAGEPPAVLAERVASRGGSTREGLKILDRDDALAALLRETLGAATRRNAEMAVEARREGTSAPIFG
jgi:pyrroline-5-carboxylate reductase